MALLALAIILVAVAALALLAPSRYHFRRDALSQRTDRPTPGRFVRQWYSVPTARPG